MKCSLCINLPSYFCPCSDMVFCKKDLIEHLDNPGNHQIEKIEALSNEELKKTKSIAESRIKLIESSKNNLISETNRAILMLEDYAKREIERLNGLLKFYMDIYGLIGTSKTQKLKIDKILNNQFKLKNIKLNLGDSIASAYFNEETMIISKINIMNLEEKKKLLEKTTSKNFITPREILFSNDKNYCFFCKP